MNLIGLSPPKRETKTFFFVVYIENIMIFIDFFNPYLKRKTISVFKH